MLLAALGFGVATRGLAFPQGFYETVAQVMPVFLLVAAVEGRFFRERAVGDEVDRFLLLGLLMVPIVGEAVCLVVIATESDALLLRGAVILAIVLLGALFAVYAMHGPARTGLGGRRVRAAPSSAASAPHDPRAPRVGLEAPPSDPVARFASDEPIHDRAEDRFGRTRLTDLIAKEIDVAPRDKGFVISLTGPWGSGKTSAINLIAERVRAGGGEAMVFNPWLFSGTEQLVGHFFAELAEHLAATERTGDLPVRIARYGEVLDRPPPGLRRTWASFVATVGAADGYDSDRATVGHERGRLHDALLAMHPRVVVLIDDLDRLTDQEIHEVVRLVKLVGDMPNVVYVLAFDDVRVELALGGDDPDGGRAFLEKIVQLSHRLPAVSTEQIREVALEELDVRLAPLGLGKWDRQRWTIAVRDGVAPYFVTLRAGRRYVNSAPAAIELAGGDIDVVDVLLLEALRLFEPRVHRELAALADVLTQEPAPFTDPVERAREHGRRIDTVMARASRPVTARALMRELFPAASQLLGGPPIVPRTAWRGERRVADRHILDCYLCVAIDEDRLAAAVVEQALDFLGDDRLSALVDSLDDDELLELVRRLGDRAGDFRPEDVEAAAAVFLAAADRVLVGTDTSVDPSEWPFCRLVGALLGALQDDSEREQAIARLFERSPDLSHKQRLLQWFGYSSNHLREEQRLVAGASARLLGRLADATAAAGPAELAAEPRLWSLLTTLVAYDEPRGRAAAIRLVASDAGLISLLLAFSSHTWDGAGPREGLRWNGLAALLGEELLESRVVAMGDSVQVGELSDDERRVVDAAVAYATGSLRPDPHR